MAKNTQTQAPATQTTEAEAPKLTFLQRLETLATPITDLTKLDTKDPLANAKTKFASNAEESLKALAAGKAEGKFFKKIANKGGERFVMFLLNGNQKMPLNGKETHYEVPNVEAATTFLTDAKAAAEAGELDAIFQATKRTRKAKAAA